MCSAVLVLRWSETACSLLSAVLTLRHSLGRVCVIPDEIKLLSSHRAAHRSWEVGEHPFHFPWVNQLFLSRFERLPVTRPERRFLPARRVLAHFFIFLGECFFRTAACFPRQWTVTTATVCARSQLPFPHNSAS